MSDDQRESFLDSMRRTGAAHARARGERVFIEEFKKSKLAMLMKVAEVAGHKTVASQEREAYADPSYVELIEGLRVSVEEEQRLFWELQVLQYRFEKWRTQQANNRAEMQHYRG